MTRKGPRTGRPPKLSAEQRAELRRRRQAGEKIVVLALEYGVTEVTASKYARAAA